MSRLARWTRQECNDAPAIRALLDKNIATIIARLLCVTCSLHTFTAASLGWRALYKGLEVVSEQQNQALRIQHGIRSRGKLVDVLHQAVKAENVHVVCALLMARVSPNQPDVWGDTPLIKAANRGCPEVAQSLITVGAKVDFQNKYGSSALIAATRSCDLETVQLLIAAGGDLELQDVYGMTALAWASREGAANQRNGLPTRWTANQKQIVALLQHHRSSSYFHTLDEE